MSSVCSSSRSSSPTKSATSISDVLKPNPHPYAIKTTSTGILSRSWSTSSSAHSHNHYVPVSPSPSPTKKNFTEYSERGSRHRYSRRLTDENSPRPLPVPPEDLFYQQTDHSRPTGSFSDSFDDIVDPKLWTCEQLAANVPDIVDFVREHEITGRAFLRFDDGVLDAYGITQHWQRSLILNHSLRLRRSMLESRILPKSNTFSEPDARRHSRSDSLSPSKGQHLPLPDEDDPAYLSSSSSISSASSVGGNKKRRLRLNGRVHGMVASYERSSSPDKAHFRRDRSGSRSSLHDDQHRFSQRQYTDDNHARPLPFPPQPTGEYVGGPLLLPQTSFPNSFPMSLNIPQPTGNSSQATPHVTGNGIISDLTTPQPTGNQHRPLPATPLHPSLRSPVLDVDVIEESIITPRNTAGEMTMDDLIAILDPNTESPQSLAFVNTDRRKAREKSEEQKKGAAAWEMNIGETVKHVIPKPPITIDTAQPAAGDDELTVEELLALEGGAGAAAWVDEPDGIVRTMKRVGSNEQETTNARFGSVSKNRSSGKGADRISSSIGRKSRGYARHVGQLFSSERGVNKHVENEQRAENETLEVERMREVERRLLHAEEEERQRWVRRAVEEVTELHKQEICADEEAELHIQEDGRLRKEEEERLHELSQRQQRMEEETRHLREAEAKEQRTKDLIVAERQRQEDVEQRLASDIAKNRRLLEEFRGRLEQVEQRVEDLETASAHSTINPTPYQTHGDTNTCVVRRLRTIAAWAISTSLGATLPAALGVPLADFVRGSNPTTNRDEATETTANRRGKSRTIVAQYFKTFPRYALLFGLGICAFMLRGLMRWGVKGVRGIGAVGANGGRGR